MIVNSYILGGSSDPILGISNLEGYYKGSSIDVAAVTEDSSISVWNDLSGNGEHAVQTGTAPILHLDSVTGQRQVTYSNVAGSGLLIQGDGGSMDFTPGTNPFSFVIQLGENIGADSGSIISKSQGTAGNRQWQVAFTDNTTLNVWVGGQSINSVIPITSRSLIFIIVRTTGVDIIVDGTYINTNFTLTGTATSSDSVFIGERTGGYVPTADIGKIAVFSKALSAPEIADIRTFHEYN